MQKTILKSLGLLLWMGGLQANDPSYFEDNFNRADNDVVGNGWDEYEPSDTRIENNQLKLHNLDFDVLLGRFLSANELDGDHVRVSCKLTVDIPHVDNAGYFRIALTEDYFNLASDNDVALVFYVGPFGDSSMFLEYRNQIAGYATGGYVDLPDVQNGDEINLELQTQVDGRIEGRAWAVGTARPDCPQSDFVLEGAAVPTGQMRLLVSNIDWGFYGILHGPFLFADDVVVTNHCDPFVRATSEAGITTLTVGDSADGLGNIDPASFVVLLDGINVTPQLIELLLTPYGHLIELDPILFLIYALDLSSSNIEVRISDVDGNSASFKSEN